MTIREDGSRCAAGTRANRLDPDGWLAGVRPALNRAGFTEDGLANTLLVHATNEPMDLATALRVTSAPTPFNVLTRLLVLARTVPRAAADDALGRKVVDALLANAFLSAEAGGVRAAAAVALYDDTVVLRDFWPAFARGATAADHVLGPGPASRTLAKLTVRRHGEDVLDLGTGSGLQALLAARHATHVTGTDTNRRALWLAELAALINGAPDIEFLHGDLYAPLADRRFDLLICNPPFVIAPRTTYEYCDSARAGDTLCEEVLRGAAGHLKPDGYATIMFNWHHADADDWPSRPLSWVADNGCDVWLIRTDTTDPVNYAAIWLNHERSERPDEYEQRLDEWLAYYARESINRISSGVIVMRRRANGANWVHAEDMPRSDPPTPCGRYIQRIFAARDYLNALNDDRQMLDAAFRLSDDHNLTQNLHADDGRWVVREATLTQPEGLAGTARVDHLMSVLLAGCDGRRTLGAIVQDLAKGLDIEFERIVPGCLGVVRRLLADGFVEAPPPCRA